MISQKLTVLLRSLSKEEFERFGVFLSSPYHNRQNYVIMLYNELAPFYPSFNDTSLSKENIYMRMYPGRSYSDTRIRNLTSDLASLAEKFISIEAFTADKFSESVYLLESLPGRKLDNMFKRKYRKTEKTIGVGDSNQGNETGYLQKLMLLEARSIFVNRRLPNDAKENLECYQGIVNETVKFFLASLFKNYSLMLNKSTTFFKYEFDTRFVDLILWYMEGVITEYREDTCIMLYYYFTVFYRNYDEESYLRLEEFTQNNFDKLDKHDAANAITNMVNYCRRHAVAGSKAHEIKAFELFKLALNSGLWSNSLRIRPNIFRAIVSTASGLGEFEWCKNFLAEYSALQPFEHIQSNTALCRARLFFEMKEYSLATQELGGVKPVDSTYKYEADTLLIRVFFEEGAIESFIDKVKSFKKWIRNNKRVISDRYSKIFTEMAVYFERLIKLRLEPDEYLVTKMKSEIEENKTLVNRLWFLEKLGEL